MKVIWSFVIPRDDALMHSLSFRMVETVDTGWPNSPVMALFRDHLHLLIYHYRMMDLLGTSSNRRSSPLFVGYRNVRKTGKSENSRHFAPTLKIDGSVRLHCALMCSIFFYIVSALCIKSFLLIPIKTTAISN